MHPGELERRVLQIPTRTATTSSLQSAVTAEQALSDLPTPDHPTAPTWHIAKDVGSVEHILELQEMHRTTNRWQSVSRDRPVRTLMTVPKPSSQRGQCLHYSASRVLTAREYARLMVSNRSTPVCVPTVLMSNPTPFAQPSQLVVELQGLPDSYTFCGSIKPGVRGLPAVYAQIANGVPVPLGRSIIRSMLDPTTAAPSYTPAPCSGEENTPGKENLCPRKRPRLEAEPMAECR